MCIDVMKNETPRLKKNIKGDFGNAYQYVIWLEATIDDIEKTLKQ